MFAVQDPAVVRTILAQRGRTNGPRPAWPGPTARICGTSAPSEVLASETVRGLARTSAGVTFEDHGEQSFKGVAEPVRVYAVKSSAVSGAR